MKVFTGKEMLENFGGLSKAMDDLHHLANGDVKCPHCEGTGWLMPPADTVEPSEEEGKE